MDAPARRLREMRSQLRCGHQCRLAAAPPPPVAATRAAAPAPPAVGGDGEGHEWLDQGSADAVYIASKLPWYGPEYSPHDVPAFYDIAGITEDVECFRRVIDMFVARYDAAGPNRPTAVAGNYTLEVL